MRTYTEAGDDYLVLGVVRAKENFIFKIVNTRPVRVSKQVARKARGQLSLRELGNGLPLLHVYLEFSFKR